MNTTYFICILKKLNLSLRSFEKYQLVSGYKKIDKKAFIRFTYYLLQCFGANVNMKWLRYK